MQSSPKISKKASGRGINHASFPKKTGKCSFFSII